MRKDSLQEKMISRSDSTLNIVFHYHGSMLTPDFIGIQLSKYHKKQKLLVVNVAPGIDFTTSCNPLTRYLQLVKQAIGIASVYFTSKNIVFSLEKHIELIQKVEDSYLMESNRSE